MHCLIAHHDHLPTCVRHRNHRLPSWLLPLAIQATMLDEALQHLLAWGAVGGSDLAAAKSPRADAYPVTVTARVPDLSVGTIQAQPGTAQII